jgi:proline dehydrogenase
MPAVTAPDHSWGATEAPSRDDGFSPAAALRHSLLWASRRRRIQHIVTASPLTRSIVHRFVAGEDVEDAVRAAGELARQGLLATLDHLGEDTRDAAAATAAVDVYRRLLSRLAAECLTSRAEVSVKLSALGRALDEKLALDNARAVCEAAQIAGTTATIDMEDHTTTDSTLQIVAQLRSDFPSVGAVIQASLHRSEADCRALATPGSRVRLCKGAYQEPASLAWQHREEIRDAFLRCVRILLEGGAYAMVATHDPVLVAATERMAGALGRAPDDHEYQMLYGIRPEEQLRLSALGRQVRVYTPFGDQWYPYLTRRMAERPANLALVLRALRSRR